MQIIVIEIVKRAVPIFCFLFIVFIPDETGSLKFHQIVLLQHFVYSSMEFFFYNAVIGHEVSREISVSHSVNTKCYFFPPQVKLLHHLQMGIGVSRTLTMREGCWETGNVCGISVLEAHQ